MVAVVLPNDCFSQATPASTEGATGGTLDSNANRLFGSVRKELMQMIPGEVDPGSQLDTSLTEVGELFSNRKLKEAQSKLEKIKVSFDGIPPTSLMLAAMAYAVGDSNSGKRLLEAAAISDGDYPDVYFSFARLALAQNRITDADALADKALLAIQSGDGAFDNAQIHHFKRRYYYAKYEVAKARGKADDAKAAVAELVAIAPQATQTLVARAEVAFDANEIDNALELLRKLDQQQTDDSFRPAEVTLASWLQRKGKINEAGALLKKTASERPRDEKIQFALVQWSINEEDFAVTLSAIKTLEEIQGNTNALRELRGKVAFAQGAYVMSENHFKRLTADNPNNFDYANLYALSLAHSPKKEKQDMAVNLARQVAQAKSDSVSAVSSLAYVLMKTDQMDAAKAILAKVAKQPNLNAEVTFILCYMLSETGEAEQAKPILERIVGVKGLFLFRTEAKKLLKMNSQSSGSLPTPNQ
jgi:predicted Zn-dependent protease